MSSLYAIVIVLLTVTLLRSVIGTNFQQQVFAKTNKPSDPSKAFKLLAMYAEKVGLHSVVTGDDKEMSGLINNFRHYANLILDVSPPEKVSPDYLIE